MTKLRHQLVRPLEKLGVEDRVWPDRDDGFSALYFGDEEFAHFPVTGLLEILVRHSTFKPWIRLSQYRSPALSSM
mgnify:CR=1 FL=1